MNSRVGRLGGHSHDSRNLTFLFRSREATTHRVYLNEVDTPLYSILLECIHHVRKATDEASVVPRTFGTVSYDLIDNIRQRAAIDKDRIAHAGIAAVDADGRVEIRHRAQVRAIRYTVPIGIRERACMRTAEPK